MRTSAVGVVCRAAGETKEGKHAVSQTATATRYNRSTIQRTAQRETGNKKESDSAPQAREKDVRQRHPGVGHEECVPVLERRSLTTR